MENLPSFQCYFRTNDTKVSPIFATFSTAHQWPTFRNQWDVDVAGSPSQPWFIWKSILPAEGCQPSKLGWFHKKKLGMFCLKNWGEGHLIFIVFLFGLEFPNRNSNLFIFRWLRRSKWIHFPILDGGYTWAMIQAVDLLYFLAWFHRFIQNSATPQPSKQADHVG